MADKVGSNGERKVFNVVGKPNIPGRLPYGITAVLGRYSDEFLN